MVCPFLVPSLEQMGEAGVGVVVAYREGEFALIF
jgi:hypothetical protein